MRQCTKVLFYIRREWAVRRIFELNKQFKEDFEVAKKYEICFCSSNIQVR